MVIVQQRIVVQSEGGAGQTRLGRKIVGARILPPLVEYPMQVTAVQEVMEPQPEAGGTQSGGPNLRVLTVHAFGPPRPLRHEMLGDGRVGPRERVRPIADHGKGLVPFVVARDVEIKA